MIFQGFRKRLHRKVGIEDGVGIHHGLEFAACMQHRPDNQHLQQQQPFRDSPPGEEPF